MVFGVDELKWMWLNKVGNLFGCSETALHVKYVGLFLNTTKHCSVMLRVVIMVELTAIVFVALCEQITETKGQRTFIECSVNFGFPAERTAVLAIPRSKRVDLLIIYPAFHAMRDENSHLFFSVCDENAPDGVDEHLATGIFSVYICLVQSSPLALALYFSSSCGRLHWKYHGLAFNKAPVWLEIIAFTKLELDSNLKNKTLITITIIT